MQHTRVTKQLSSDKSLGKGNVIQPHSRNKKVRKDSFKGFLLFSIAVASNFFFISNFFVNKVNRNASSAIDGRASLVLDQDIDNKERKKMHRLSSPINKLSSVPYKTVESTLTNGTYGKDKIKMSFDTNIQKLSSMCDEKNRGQFLSKNGLITISNSAGGKLISPSSKSIVPYYLNGKTKYKHKKFHHKRTFRRIGKEEAKPVSPSQKVWVLPDPVKLPTRNHESILLEYETSEGVDKQISSKQILVNILGRYSRGVQWLDLESGQQRSMESNGTDPDQRPLNDLNHVASVLVDSLEPDENGITRKEVWLPCGFHNDRVGKELSSNYVRIVDLETMEVRAGPKLPYSGGACGAASIEPAPGKPPLICAFGGTNGNHDTGIFLPYVSCYDRLLSKWVFPFGKLPVGMDHLSVVMVPRAVCNVGDPARVLVFNFRTKNYSTHTSAEILAFDIPNDGWTRDELENASAEQEGRWYVFANHSFDGREDEVYAPRDASGVVMANGGKSVVNFGGINQVRNPLWKKKDRSNGPKVFSTWYSTIRELNVCTKKWEKVADLGIQTFALMASASTKLNTAFFCGGSMSRNEFNGNTNLCLAIRIPGIEFWNHRKAAVENFPNGFQAGGRVDANVSLTTDDGRGADEEQC